MYLVLFQVLVAGALAGQTDALYAGTVPADVPTFKVTLGNAPAFYAALRVDGDWVLDHRTELKPSQVVDFVLDDPFYTGEPSRTLMRNARVEYEPPAMRRKRLSDTWTSHGYTFLETAAGWRAVRETDIKQAGRAREMARAASQAGSTPSGQAADATGTGAGAPPVQTRFSTGVVWSIRAGICAAVALVLAVIFVFGRREKGEWTRLN